MKEQLTYISLTAVMVLSLLVFMFRPASAAISYQSVASSENATGSTSLTISKPSGTVQGDLLVAAIGVNGTATVTAPSDWTVIRDDTVSTRVRLVSMYKVVTNIFEGNNYQFNFSSSVKASGGIVHYAGVDTAQPIDVHAMNSSATNTTSMTAPSVTTTVPNTMLVSVFANNNAVNHTAGSGMTQRFSVFSSGRGNAATKVTTSVQDTIQATAGSSGTKSATSASGNYVAHTFAIREAPVISQTSYRFFQNSDSTTASAPLAARDTPAVVERGTAFRLRLNLGVASGGSNATAASDRQFTLEFAKLTAASCSVQTGYAALTMSSAVRFYNNPTPANGVAYVSSANDPTRAGVTSVGQKYHEANPLSLATNTPAGQDMLWDIALGTSGGEAFGDIYCLRVANLSGSYAIYPQITIATPLVSQANYRWFANADSTAPGGPLATQDTAATVAPEVPFRLRQRLAVDGASLPAGQRNYKLQYGEKVTTCSAADYMSIIAGETLPRYGTVASQDTSGTMAWSNVNRMNQYDGLESGLFITGGAIGGSHNAILTGYGFSIPASATVTGIEIVAQDVTVTPGLNGTIAMSAGVSGIAGSSTIGSGNLSSGSQSEISFGGPTNLFGLSSISPADINSSSFGATLRASYKSGFPETSLWLDSVFIKVYYQTPDGVIRYQENPGPTSGDAITSIVGDPTNSSRSAVYQSYLESDPFSNSSNIPAGQDGIWDFALTSDASTAGKTYCFRVVSQDGTPLDNYAHYPEVTFGSTGPTLSQMTRGGSGVINGVKQRYHW